MDNAHLGSTFLQAENINEYIKARSSRVPEASSNSNENLFLLVYLQSSLPNRFAGSIADRSGLDADLPSSSSKPTFYK